MKIVVLAGGISTERTVSLVSGTCVCQALRRKGHQAILVDMFMGLENAPAYLYEPCMIMMGLTYRLEPEETKNITWFYLPAAKGQIERAMARSGISDPADMRFRFSESMFPDEVDAALDFR